MARLWQAAWWRKLGSQVSEDTSSARSRKKQVRMLLAKLKECKSLQRGRKIHAEATETGIGSSIYVATALVNMYAKCRSMVDARQVFSTIENPNVVSWTALILGYADNGEGATALDMFARMKSRGCAPNSVTYISVLKACASLAVRQKRGILERGRQIHSEICCHLDKNLQNSLIDMYSKCGCMADARQVFDSLTNPDVVSWTALILGYADNGEGIVALDLFTRMKSQGCVPDLVTYVAALKACASLSLGLHKAECLAKGKQIHSEIGCHSNICAHNTLIDMYSKCGSILDARQVFDTIKQPDVVSWNTLILGYAENGESVTALELFAKMQFQGHRPDSGTFVAALKACAILALEQDGGFKAECLDRGKQIHLEIGHQPDINVQNTLIDMYAKCGCMSEARNVFDRIKHPDVVSWTALIMGYADNGEAATALDLFTRMKARGCAPNHITLFAALKACGLLGSLETGRKIHAEMDTETEAGLVTCLVDFYAKCGNLSEARRIFDSHCETRDLRTWNTLLAGCSRLGDSVTALELFEGLQDAGFRPNGVTFLCMLASCSHAGLVEMAKELLDAMPCSYRVTPNVGHYNCMVDILGRSNKLDEAIALLRGMPCRPDAVTWKTVLDACRKWKNLGIGRLAFKSLVSLDETDASPYVLMAHIYGSRGMWQEQDRVLGLGRRFETSCAPNI